MNYTDGYYVKDTRSYKYNLGQEVSYLDGKRGIVTGTICYRCLSRDGTELYDIDEHTAPGKYWHKFEGVPESEIIK